MCVCVRARAHYPGSTRHVVEGGVLHEVTSFATRAFHPLSLVWRDFFGVGGGGGGIRGVCLCERVGGGGGEERVERGG